MKLLLKLDYTRLFGLHSSSEFSVCKFCLDFLPEVGLIPLPDVGRPLDLSPLAEGGLLPF